MVQKGRFDWYKSWTKMYSVKPLSNKNKRSCNMYFSIWYSYSYVRMSTTMRDESGLFITVESAYGHINVLNGDGDWKEKSKDGKYQKCMVMQYSKMLCKRSSFS